MKVDLFEYMAYCHNKANAKAEEEYKDFEKRMEEYRREQAAERAANQMQLDSVGKKIVQDNREWEQRKYERERAAELEAIAKRKRGGR